MPRLSIIIKYLGYEIHKGRQSDSYAVYCNEILLTSMQISSVKIAKRLIDTYIKANPEQVLSREKEHGFIKPLQTRPLDGYSNRKW